MLSCLLTLGMAVSTMGRMKNRSNRKKGITIQVGYEPLRSLYIFDIYSFTSLYDKKK